MPNPSNPNREPSDRPDAHSTPYYTYPGDRSTASPAPDGRARRTRVLGAIIVVFLVGAVGALVLLPKLTQKSISYTTLTAQNHAIAVLRVVEGLAGATSEPEFTLSVNPEAPDTDFAVALDAASIEEFSNGRPRAADWMAQARVALSSVLSLQTQLYVIQTQGTPPQTLTLTFDLPAPTSTPQLLDVYGWDAERDTWRFFPSTVNETNDQIIVQAERLPNGIGLFLASPPAPLVGTRLTAAQTVREEARPALTLLSPVGLRPTLPNGSTQTLTGNLAPGFSANVGYNVWPVIRNYEDLRAIDSDTVTRLLSDASLRVRHIQQIATSARAGGYRGIFIDYRGLPDDLRDDFSAFIVELRARLADDGIRLGVVVPAAEQRDGEWFTGAYDWQTLGGAAHLFQIAMPIDPTTYLPGEAEYAESLFRWVVRLVPREKILVNLSALSVRETPSGTLSTVTTEEAFRPLGNVVAEFSDTDGTISPGSTLRVSMDGLRAIPGTDAQIDAAFFDYITAGGDLSSRVWLMTRRALRFRLQVVRDFALGGVVVEDLLSEEVDEALYAELISYREMTPPEDLAVTDLRLRWYIDGETGTVQDFYGQFNEAVVVTLDAPEGHYTVNMSVVDGESAGTLRQDGVAVALYAPTATPTRLPDVTQRPAATWTPTLIPVVATPLPATAFSNSAMGGLSAPGGAIAGSINLSGFEYGGHVTDAASTRAITPMRSAGMTWMKVQIRYGPGANPAGAQSQISAAHANGFKILLGVVGSPNDLSSGGQGYVQGFAAFVGQIAALGPDAIEIWNEPNLGREWPAGQISGGNYAALLGQAANAIRAANPNVIIISGAPAPTGAQASFPGNVVNDDVFLTEMVRAGALDYVDCIGVHYNEGIISPTATSGDPRGDNYYTRYLPTLLNTYDGITGNRKPYCITELGYLSSEGFGTLPASFAWASGVTVQQQASYLAGAAAYVSNRGDVRMMIVWNVDFTRYDSDPMGGYAIIRPDGSCPACDALARSR